VTRWAIVLHRDWVVGLFFSLYSCVCVCVCVCVFCVTLRVGEFPLLSPLPPPPPPRVRWQAAILTLENQITHPEVLGSWFRGERRAKWRATVAGGGVSVTAAVWQEAVKRIAAAAAAARAMKAATATSGSTWLGLCDEATALGTLPAAAPSAGADADMCVSTRAPCVCACFVSRVACAEPSWPGIPIAVEFVPVCMCRA
jgi:hypothetical protein